MKKYGKNYLYDFLKSNDYNIPKINDMEYGSNCSSEWICTRGYGLFDIEAFCDNSQKEDIITVTVGARLPNGQILKVERSKFLNGLKISS